VHKETPTVVPPDQTRPTGPTIIVKPQPPPPPPPPTPFMKRHWWIVPVTVVVAGAAVSLGIYYGMPRPCDSASLGCWDLSKTH
jgi:hypothetical protein